MKIMSVTAKSSDLFHAEFFDTETGQDKEVDGYCPQWTGVGDGDYVRFKVDIETGQILNWNKDEVLSHVFEQDNQ